MSREPWFPYMSYRLIHSKQRDKLFKAFSILLIMVKDRLYRNTKEKVIAGVCAGIADHFDTDPVLIRLMWVFLTLISVGAGILAYIIAWIIIPRKN